MTSFTILERRVSVHRLQLYRRFYVIVIPHVLTLRYEVNFGVRNLSSILGL